MFEPPRCPNPGCAMHTEPEPDFYRPRGSYRSSVKAHPIPRFRCLHCLRSFSRQTFRHDYRDKKPHLNVRVVEFLCSGVGYRQTARMVRMTRNNLEAKARKIQRTMGDLDTNLITRAGDVDRRNPGEVDVDILFDEFETYETCRNTMPLSVPTAVENKSLLILGSRAAPIRPRGRMSAKRLRRIAAHERRYGPRKDESPEACRWVLGRAAKLRPTAKRVRLGTDCKTTYPGYAREAFGEERLVHHRTLGSEPRDGRSPLATINFIEALMRDLIGRLRRQSWLVSKQYEYLNLHLGQYACWRNWSRPRYNADDACPGQFSGFAERRLRRSELVGWRQDWGQLSPSPYRDGSVAVGAEWAA